MPARIQNAKSGPSTILLTKDVFDLDFNGVDDGDDNMNDMLSLMQEYQRKKNAKVSNRNASLQSKLTVLLACTKKESEIMENEGRAYIEQAKNQIEELRAQETSWDELLEDSMQMWAAHEGAFESLLSVYPEVFEELSPQRAEVINSASEMLETHPIERERSRRRLMKSARKNMELGMERQKLATDASALIKHYKALLSA